MGKTAKGFLWSGIDYFSVQIVQFVLSIIIARLVAPSAYGVIVMVQVFMSFAQLFIDGGFKTALIQKKDRTSVDYNTVFIFNMIIAVSLYLVLFFFAPLIASFYNEPQLTSLTRAIGLNLIFSSLSITQLVRLQADLNFKVQAKARLIAVTISGIIGVYCAYCGMEVWALVIQGLVNTLLTSIMLMFFSRWMPKLEFSKASFKGLFGFGSKLLFSNFITTCYIQLSNLAIGKFYMPANLAYYNRGFYLSQIPSVSIMEVINRIVFPILVLKQNDMSELLVSYRKYLRLSCLVIFPMLVLIAVLSKPLILFLLTEKWIGAAELLSIFCIVFLFYPLISNPGNVITALGYSNLVAKGAVIKRSVGFCILIASLFISVRAVAFGLVLNNAFESFINLRYCKKCTRTSIHTQLGYIGDIAFISILSALTAYFVKGLFDNALAQLFVSGFAGVFVFVASMFLFRLEEVGYIKMAYNKIIKRNLK
jgi:O-antigen/teichoic acid export membrane protein